MRKLIAAMKLSVDGMFQGPSGYADWVDAWSEDYGLTPQIDACIVGGGMYPGYEAYWSAMQRTPDEPLPMTGMMATAAEQEWAQFAAKTPHYVLSTTPSTATWPNTTSLRSLDEVAALKRQPGKAIYVMGGGTITARLIDAGLLDEIRLITYPIIAGGGASLFANVKTRRALDLQSVEQRDGGRILTVFSIGQSL